jgi:TetR/AcrR family transcriptional regulator
MDEMDKRGRILEVAEELFAKKGYSEATMREIAERVDMKKPSLYHHFRSKEDIYYTLIIDIYAKLLDEIIDLLQEGDTVEEKVRLGVSKIVDIWARHPNYPTIMAYEMATGSELIASELLPKIWQPRLDEAVEEFERAKAREPQYRDVDSRMILLMIFGIPIFYFFSGQVFSTLLGGDHLAPEMIERFKRELTELILYGLQKSKDAQG